MIYVKVYRATQTIINKNSTFIEGELYFLRHSKHGDKAVMRNEEGHWVIVGEIEPFYTLDKVKPEGFKWEINVFMKNRKRMNKFDSAREYIRLGADQDWLKSVWFSYHSYEDVSE